ncbi:hypothetical protein [Streptomyces sp. NPDC093260]|uniref:hypothetical protein n=1 Tax=Streptomyces sp. NPDC093260 TaxID=3155073 RepID=UPI00341A2CD4
MTAATALKGPAPRRRPDSDPYVLRTRQLRPGVTLKQTSRYSDDVWQLTFALLQEHQRSFILNFLSVPERFRPAAKRLFYCLLTADPPDGEDPISVHTVRSYFSAIKALMLWLDKRWPPARTTLRELTPQDLDAYNRHLLATYPHQPTNRCSHRTTIRILWRWRTRLGPEAFRFYPLRLDGWSANQAARQTENTTDRLPEPVMGPLLGWAFRFVDEFSADILRAEQRWRQPRLGRATYPRRKGAIEARLRHMLNVHIARKRPLPGHEGHPNVEHIARTLGCNRKAVDAHMHLIIDAAAVVGIAPFSYFDTDITGRLDGEPWIDGIATFHLASTSLASLRRHLQAACYIVIAFLSGMRDSEVKHLRRGCLQTHRDEDGNPYRWKLRSLAFKGERDTAGIPATWIVGEPVARAVKVLEALQRPGVDYLFYVLGDGPRKQKATFAAMTGNATNQQLNRFVTWINDYCSNKGRSDFVPKVNKMVFRLKTSHFRRTLAWFIARRPGGVIAGALQYRHHSIQMFEGYAGTSDSGFRAEVESEQALSRGEFYTEKTEAHEHTDFMGPAAEEVALRLQDFGERAQFQGQLALSKNRLLRIMRRHDPGVYPGIYITCVHDPAKALCEKARRGRGEGLPEHGGCQPLACRNVALTLENTQAWQRELDRIGRRLTSRPLLPPLVAHRLNQRRAEITQFLLSNGIPVTAP